MASRNTITQKMNQMVWDVLSRPCRLILLSRDKLGSAGQPYQLNMKKSFALLLALILLASANDPVFQSGSSIANLVRSQTGRYYGQYRLHCNVCQAPYNVEWSELPTGWSQQNGLLNIPNIVNINNGEYALSARVTDAAGHTYSDDIVLNINGVNVRISSASSNADNLISVISAPSLATATTGGSTAGSTTTVSSSSSVSTLYESYPGLPEGSIVAPANGRYPVPASPSGPPQDPNIVPTVIQNSQATYVESRDSKTVTVETVKQNAAFQRQLNANKAVANLIAIIQQLTANVNAAKADIVTLETHLMEAEQANNDCNNKIYELANSRTKIENAIRDRQNFILEINAKIGELNPILNDLIRTREVLVNQRTEMEKLNSPNAARLAQLESDLADCMADRQDLEDQLADLRIQIQSVRTQIQIVRIDAAQAPATIIQIDAQIPIVEARIADLRRQLTDAEAERSQLISDRAMYERLIREVQSKVAQLNGQISLLQARIPRMEREIENKHALCDRITVQIDEIRDELSEHDASFSVLTVQIRTQDGLIEDQRNQIHQLKISIENAPGEIAALQAEHARMSTAITRQYYICNDAAEGVRVAKQNLEAMRLKYSTETAWLKEANVNLQKARSEKELADIAVQQIISSSTSALPFSIVPNGQGQTNVGIPAGNNAAGNALGAVRQRNEIVPGSPIVVGDLRYYLSSAYGVGVDPTKPSSVTTLYPLSTLTIEALTGHSQAGVFNPDGTFVSSSNLSGSAPYGGAAITESYLATHSCGTSNNVVQGHGQVLGVQPGMIRVRGMNGEQIHLNVASCSNMNSNKQNLTVVPYMNLYYTGTQTQHEQVINLDQMTIVI